jgi:hypothetical protein
MAKRNSKPSETRIRNSLAGFCKIQFLFILVFAGQTILYDASQLITPQSVLRRWVAISGLLAVNGGIWYLVRSRSGHRVLYKSLVALMVLSNIAMASFLVYEERGMASRAVFLYIFPIIISGVLLSRSALYATAIFSVAAYSLTAVSYFVLNFNEGYKVELYGEVAFYSLIMLLSAGLLARLLHSGD